MLMVAGDEQLPVAAARAGDAEAWAALFRRYQLPLYVYVVELVHNEQTALDIVQEAFIAATRHIGGLREDGRFGSWLFSIAHQRCQQQWRKPKREEPLPESDELDAHAGEEESPHELLIRREQEQQFMELLGGLSEAHRSVVLLHFLEDFSLAEITEITGATLGTVKSRLHYAKRELRKLWEMAK